MSLFDVLRYPVSDKPTIEELQSLPINLYLKWCTEGGWKDPNVDYDFMINIYFRMFPNKLESEIASLRKLIKEWDSENEPI